MEIELKEIDENPEAYGFTSGCAVYYLDKNQVLNLKILISNFLCRA